MGSRPVPSRPRKARIVGALDAKQEVRGLGCYRKTLTVLSVPSLVDETFQDEDEDEDADLEESWTPRFRR